MTEQEHEAKKVEVDDSPDVRSPAYALRELADWIEHRTGGTEPRDVARIELGRSMADLLDEQASAAASLDLRSIHNKLDLILSALSLKAAVEELNTPCFDGESEAPYQIPVASIPAEPVEAHACSILTFDRSMITNTLKVRCDAGHHTDIDLSKLSKNSDHDPLSAMRGIVTILAADHGLDAQRLYDKMRKHAIRDLQTITVGTSSLLTPHQE